MLAIAGLAAGVAQTRGFGAVEAVSPAEARAWVRHVIPLPKGIELPAKVVVAPSTVAVDRSGQDDSVTSNAVAQLRKSLGPAARTGNREPAFRLMLQIGGAEAEPLTPLPNSEQAYRLLPSSSNDGLRLIAASPTGLLYAATTLCQLLDARATSDRVEIPLATLTDWPDMAERGLWGSDSFLCLSQLGAVKMNLCEQIAQVWVDEDGKGHGKLKPGREPMIEEGPRHGVRPLPAVVHLNQLKGKGLFEAFPNLLAKGGDEGAICYSQPEIVGVLTDWIADLGGLPHVTDVSVWLTENLHGKGGCTCEQCSQHDRNVLETQVVLRAWEAAKARVPDVGLRVLLSEETYRSNEKILSVLPGEVKVGYYHSLLTYTTYRRPMIEPLFEDWCRRGRWLGVTPQLTGDVGPATPFTGAAFVRYRMNELVGKGVSCLTGYATPRLQHCRFNVEAAAEWSWNANGRSTREFAESYAVRHGLADADMFAEWSEALGPVAWRLYGSEWPTGERRKALTPVVRALREGKLPPLGTVLWGVYAKPWGQYESDEQLRDDLAAAVRAVALARQLGAPEVLEESLTIEGYARSLNALWELRQIVKPEGIAPRHKQAAQAHFADFIQGCDQARQAVGAWAKLVAPDLGENDGGRYWKVVEILERLSADMRQLRSDLGAAP